MSHFCHMTQSPPISTLFPYTTLFRSKEAAEINDLALRPQRLGSGCNSVQHLVIERTGNVWVPIPEQIGSSNGKFHHRRSRSEEHTSELQSQSNLVCRLLLEKKNNA